MPTTLEIPSSRSPPLNTSGPMKRKRGWQTDILAFAADDSSEEDEGDDGEMVGEEDEEDGVALGDETGLGASNMNKRLKQSTSNEDARPLNRDQILMREASTHLSLPFVPPRHQSITQTDIIPRSWISVKDPIPLYIRNHLRSNPNRNQRRHRNRIRDPVRGGMGRRGTDRAWDGGTR